MFTLSDKTKEIFAKRLGSAYESEELQQVSTATFSRKKHPLMDTFGSPYLSRRKFTTMAELDAQMEKMIEESESDGCTGKKVK